MAATTDLNFIVPRASSAVTVAAVIADVGEKASYRFLEFFTANIQPTVETAPVFHPPEGKTGFQKPTWTKPHAAGQARSFSCRIGINQRMKGVRPYDPTTKANAGGVAASQLC